MSIGKKLYTVIQTYSMILWAKPHEANINDMTDICYQVLNELKNYGEELAPKFLSAKKKSDVKEFEFNKNNIKLSLEKNVNKEGGTTFPDLGRSLNFFSSLSEELSCGISIRIGTSNPKFINSLVIRFPYGDFSGFSDQLYKIDDLFKRLISVFNPFFGFISNSLNSQLSDEFWNKHKPTYVHWMNYYNKSTAENIGIDKLLEVNQCEAIGDGYFLKLFDEPLDIENREHISCQYLLSKQLGLL